LPYGISSVSELFQKKIYNVLQSLEGVACIVDDILVYGRHHTGHDVCLRAVLDILRAAQREVSVLASKIKMGGTHHLRFRYQP
jgi:hypothetical protein